MDTRDFLLGLLENYKGFDASEEQSRVQIIAFVKAHSECFQQRPVPGHVTGSALVIDRAYAQALLTHHKKLNKWIQFGGHSDGHPNPFDVALRETREESGLQTLVPIPGHEGIFDVDVHPIPEHNGVLAHYHYDIRIILSADRNEPFVISSESKDLRWIALDAAETYNASSPFLRLIKKAQRLRK